MSEKTLSKVLLYLGPALFLLTLVIDLPLRADQHRLMGIMLLVICWWLSPAIPLAVTGLVGISLCTLLGVATFPDALLGFSNPVIFLFMGGFFIAQALTLNGLDIWIAKKFLSLSFIKGNPRRLFLGITFLTCAFSTILSNTATAAMFIPIALSLFHHLKIDKTHPAAILILMIPWAANIGGIATPIGSTPNVISLSLLQKSHGISIRFVDWMYLCVPLLLFVMTGMVAIFWKELKSLNHQSEMEEALVPAPTKAQKRLLVMLVLTLLCWIMPGIFQILFGLEHEYSKFISARMPEGLVAMAMGSALFFIPGENDKNLLNWDEAKKIDWGTLVLFGSGIALGEMMFKTGLAKYFGELLPFSSMPFALAILIIIVSTVFFSEIASNTATANLVIPVLLSTAPFMDKPLVSSMAASLAASLAFMLPVGTPPNAMAYGTGLVKGSAMMRKGLWLNLASILGIWLLSEFGS